MNPQDFTRRWDGPSLVTALESRLETLRVSQRNKEFLLRAGLPSNALYFYAPSSEIMTFDCVRTMRCLSEMDVSPRMCQEVAAGPARLIVGVYRSMFITLHDSPEGFLEMIDRDPICIHADMDDPPAMSHAPIYYLNDSPQAFGECLIAFRDLCFAIGAADFSSPSTKGRVDAFRAQLQEADHRVFMEQPSYWSQVYDDIDVW